MFKTISKIVAVIALSTAGFASATPITSLSGSTTYNLPAVNLFTAGPVAVSSDISWSSQNSYSVYGYTGGYGFAGNGSWSGLSMVGSNDSTSSMSFSFSSAVSGVGAFLNWAPGYGSSKISIYDAANTLLETFAINFLTNGSTNSGEFHGFSRASADISRFELSGGYIGAANLEVVKGSVPEPTSIAMLVLGLLGLRFARRTAK